MPCSGTELELLSISQQIKPLGELIASKKKKKCQFALDSLPNRNRSEICWVIYYKWSASSSKCITALLNLKTANECKEMQRCSKAAWTHHERPGLQIATQQDLCTSRCTSALPFLSRIFHHLSFFKPLHSLGRGSAGSHAGRWFPLTHFKPDLQLLGFSLQSPPLSRALPHVVWCFPVLRGMEWNHGTTFSSWQRHFCSQIPGEGADPHSLGFGSSFSPNSCLSLLTFKLIH